MEDPQCGDRKAVLYFCGSNAEALNKVAELVKDVGFEGVGVDNIEFARTLEPLALVWMAGLDRFGTEHAFGLLKRYNQFNREYGSELTIDTCETLKPALTAPHLPPITG